MPTGHKHDFQATCLPGVDRAQAFELEPDARAQSGSQRPGGLRGRLCDPTGLQFYNTQLWAVRGDHGESLWLQQARSLLPGSERPRKSPGRLGGRIAAKANKLRTWRGRKGAGRQRKDGDGQEAADAVI